MCVLCCPGILSMSMTSRDIRWLIYFQNVAVAARAAIYADGAVQAAVDFGKVEVEAAGAVEGVEVMIVVAVADLEVVMVGVVPTEVAVVHNLLFSTEKTP